MDERNHRNRNKNGCQHNSVIGSSFPIKEVTNIVPAILHIHLGIVLELFNDLENCCIEIDEKNSAHLKVQKNDKEQLKLQITKLSNDLLAHQEQMIALSLSIIDLKNIEDRIYLIEEDPSRKKLIKHVKDSSRKRKPCKQEDVCYSPQCLITMHDFDRKMIQCEKCEKWSHYMCEGVGDSEEISEYTCLICQNMTKSKDILISFVLFFLHQR